MLHTKIIDIKDKKLSLVEAEQFISSSDFGASIFFSGTVRNQNNNKSVTGITYDSHDSLVIKSFEEIYNEADQKLNIREKAVFIEHAKGYLNLGEISIIIAVACKHRDEAYILSRYIIEEIKKRSPIWKKEHYQNNETDWLKGNPIQYEKIKYSEITPEKVYLNRRSFIKSIGLSAGSAALTSIPFINHARSNEENKLTSYKDITTYNNYYEFGTSKSDPYINSQQFKTTPWTISIEGEVEKPIKLSMDEITETFISEERIYRLRCVEGWSMVIPWMGFSLSELLSKVNPTSKAKFIEFESVYDPEQMKGQRYPVLNWPYKEGLRIDEAMHPLTTVVTGLYGKKLPNQNGAPLRIFTPWKYGFKSAKAIVKIKFVEKMPTSSWMWASPREYGFYSNVNPNVDHPRWSQATERVIGNDIFAPRVKTLMFNGYGDEVANLYTGMDLKNIFNDKIF